MPDCKITLHIRVRGAFSTIIFQGPNSQKLTINLSKTYV